MLAEDLHGTVHRQRFDRMALAGDRGGPKHRVVDCLLSGLDYSQEKRRHRVVAKYLEISCEASISLVIYSNTDLGRGRKGDDVVAAAVAPGASGPGQAQHGP